MSCCLVGFGSNAGDPERYLAKALQRLSAHSTMRVVGQSRSYRTRPAGGPGDQLPYLNAVFRCETSLEPVAVLQQLQGIERELGRVRQERWGARTVDLDLLLYDEAQLATQELTVPHPRMAFRRFVLVPAAEVGGEMVHPTMGWTVRELLARLDESPPYVAVVGAGAARQRAVAAQAVDRIGCRSISDPGFDDFQRVTRDACAAAGQRCGDDSAEASYQSAILQQRISFLAEVSSLPRPGSVREFVISDFGCIESRSLANVSLVGAELAAFDAVWRTVPAELIFPRLLVFLTEPTATSEEGSDSAAAVFGEELKRLVEQPRQCPVLTLGADTAWAVEELVAAVVAMQPLDEV